MTLRLECIGDSDRRVLKVALTTITVSKYRPKAVMKAAEGVSIASIQDEAWAMLTYIERLPPCGMENTNDVQDVAHVIEVNIRRGDVERAREWYLALQGKDYTPELEEELARILTLEERQQLKR